MKSCLGNLLRIDYKVMGQERKELLEVLITSMIGLGIFKEDNRSRLISEHVVGKEKSGSLQATPFFRYPFVSDLPVTLLC